jgi:hypothetical protein
MSAPNSTGTASTGTTASAATSMSTNKIIGIVVGVIVVLSIIIGVTVGLLTKKKAPAEEDETPIVPPADGETLVLNADTRLAYEKGTTTQASTKTYTKMSCIVSKVNNIYPTTVTFGEANKRNIIMAPYSGPDDVVIMVNVGGNWQAAGIPPASEMDYSFITETRYSGNEWLARIGQIAFVGRGTAFEMSEETPISRGVFRSTDDGDTWKAHAVTLERNPATLTYSDFHGIWVTGANALSGSTNMISWSDDGGVTWLPGSVTLPSASSIVALNNNGKFFRGIVLLSGTTPSVTESVDGKNWSNSSEPLLAGFFPLYLCWSPFTLRWYLAGSGTGNVRIMYNDDDGTGWKSVLNSAVPFDNVTGIEADGSGIVVVTGDGADTFLAYIEEIEGVAPSLTAVTSFMDGCHNLYYTGTVFILVSGDDVYESADGQTWSISLSTPQFTTAFGRGDSNRRLPSSVVIDDKLITDKFLTESVTVSTGDTLAVACACNNTGTSTFTLTPVE